MIKKKKNKRLQYVLRQDVALGSRWIWFERQVSNMLVWLALQTCRVATEIISFQQQHT
jgi:hypothetical protein